MMGHDERDSSLEVEGERVGGVATRDLMSHRPGERFAYGGGIFTRLVFSNSLAMWLRASGMPEESIRILQASFLASDQFGVVNIFTRDEQVIAIDSLPGWANFYRTHPDGFPDARKILVGEG